MVGLLTRCGLPGASPGGAPGRHRVDSRSNQEQEGRHQKTVESPRAALTAKEVRKQACRVQVEVWHQLRQVVQLTQVGEGSRALGTGEEARVAALQLAAQAVLVFRSVHATRCTIVVEALTAVGRTGGTDACQMYVTCMSDHWRCMSAGCQQVVGPAAQELAGCRVQGMTTA